MCWADNGEWDSDTLQVLHVVKTLKMWTMYNIKAFICLEDINILIKNKFELLIIIVGWN